MRYIKFKLTPGQKPPIGSSGIVLSNGYIVFVEGEENTFIDYATFGSITTTDPEPFSKIKSYIMTQDEITEYENILNSPSLEEQVKIR